MCVEDKCKYLFDDASSFLKFYNWHYFRPGIYIEELHKLAILIVSHYSAINIDYDDFFEKYKKFFELEYYQYSKFYFFDYDKRLEVVKEVYGSFRK